ncbi:MAG: hypothetical protein L0Y72_13675 [Gemmataceae bacterium]|nr:hypothetical protein [Gemmataceae bacterium]MCI0740090.1 hypothetical protein [Gemmataceae bacterium]
MKFAHWASCILMFAAAAVLVSASGCAKEPPKKSGGDGKQEIVKGKEGPHEGWWCAEHGVPEEMCSLCSADVAAKLKKEGDWCKLHDRAQSQCFKCDPSKYAKFEAMHEAKFGKKPERPPETEFKK